MPSEDRERDWQLGKVHRKVDAMERMRGVARYTDDLKLPGMLHAKILRSPHAHARIKGIDLAPALALPGVFAAVTGQDFKIPYGVIPWTPDENALAVDKVCHVGDGVVAIAAVDEDTANAACKAVVVDYEPLRAFFDPEQALAVRDREGTINPYSRKGNVSKHVLLEFGEVDAELASSDLVIEGDYFFGGTTHGAIEPHCAVAQVEPNGILTVWSATQVSHYLHRELAKVLELPPHRIRVIQPPLGGAFGGKSEPFDLEFCVAKLAMKTGRPVKLLYTREEVFYAHRGRHPMKMKYRTGFTREGKIKAVDARTILDGGAYSSFGALNCEPVLEPVAEGLARLVRRDGAAMHMDDLAAALLYVAIGPSLIAYRAWGLGVATVGPTVATFFANLTPVFAGLLSAALLGEAPRWYHAAAFALIAAGIVVSALGARRR